MTRERLYRSTRTALALAACALITATPARSQAVPADADAARAALDASPRHGEWVRVRTPAGDSIRAWVVYPERSGPAPVVLVIHEIFGLTHWVRAVADRLAAEGFLAVAPDLLTMAGVPADAGGEPDRQAATAAIRTLDPDAVHGWLRAVAEHAMALPGARDAYSITGFCWGGAASFEHAARYGDRLVSAVVWYGGSPEQPALGRVAVPVLGFYGGDDERVNATIPRARDALGDRYVARLYDGAGHGFLRQQTGRDGANLRASEQAWPHMVGFLTGVHAGDRRD